MMRSPWLRPRWISCAAFSERHVLPHTRHRTQNPYLKIALSPRRHIYNVSGPRYHTHCTGCGQYRLWYPEKDGQFFCKGFLREDLAEYRSGGYHPVHLGDTLQDGRQKIVQKLGYGRDATVWLAEDRRLARHVAIKIYRSDRRHDEEEARTLRQLTEEPSDYDGKDHIVQLLDRFELKGPNGRHLCLVLEALGPNIHLYGLSPESSWEIARQLVEATAYFQSLGIVHGDLSPRSILFANTSLLHRDGNPLKSLKMPKIGNVRVVDDLGNVESLLGQCSTARVPGYLVESAQQYPQSLRYDAANDSRVKIIGFEEPFPARNVPGGSYNFYYQAPELLFGSPLSPRAEIWSLGCLIYDLICGEQLFEAGWETEEDKNYIIQEYITAFGELPEEWKDHGPPHAREPGLVPGGYNILHRLHEELSVTRPGTKWFSETDLDMLGDLLNSMMQFRPSERPTADEVLKHPWFQHRPLLVAVKGPTEAEQALADLETLKSMNLDPKTPISRNFFDRWYKRG